MGVLYDTLKKKAGAPIVAPKKNTEITSVLSPVQNLSQSKNVPSQTFTIPKAQTKPKSLYERIKSKQEQKVSMTERKPVAEMLAPSPISYPGTSKTSTSPTPTTDLTISQFAKVMGQGMARTYSATGGRLAKNLGTAETDVIDPKTYFGDSETGKKVAEATFGTAEPFNATSEDIAFLESFGVDPEIAKGTGGSLTMLMGALDLTGAGGAPKGLSGAIKSIRAVKTAEEAVKLAKSLKLSDDVAQQYADAFVKAETVKEAKEALEQATKAQTGGPKLPTPEGLPQIPAKPYTETGDLSTKLLAKLEGKTTVSKQFISDLTNSGDLKQAERDLFRALLADEGDKVNVTEFANKVKSELLPLARNDVASSQYGSGTRYESVNLPEELRGPVYGYKENIYGSPIKTSAGSVHFNGQGADNYFAHSRIEDLPGELTTISKGVKDSRFKSLKQPFDGYPMGTEGTTRRVIEIQSDLFQKGRLESEKKPWQTSFEKTGYKPESLTDLEKLEPYRNTWHERIVREEVKKAAQDGKTKLQFPTGETAMKIEGLGEAETQWRAGEFSFGKPKLTKEGLAVGQEVSNGHGQFNKWIITEVLGDGKFKAVPKSVADKIDITGPRTSLLASAEETFDISGKVDQSNPIYKFYEKEVGRYLKNKYNAQLVTDAQGVSWWELNVDPKLATKPTEAFGMLGGISQDEEGNFTFNPVGAALGVAGARAFKKLPTNAQIDELAKRVKELGKVGKEELGGMIDELSTGLAITEDAIESMPGKALNRYVSRTTGNLPEITGKETMQSLTGNKKIVKTSAFGQKGDEIIQNIYDGKAPDMAKVEDDLAQYRNARERIDNLKKQIAEKRTDLATLRKAERLTKIGMQERKMRYRAVAGAFNLTDAELAKFRRGRDISSMERGEFEEFITEAGKYGELIQKRSEAMVMLKATLYEKDLKKWENLQQAMNLPPVHQMNTEQLINFEKILDQYKAGDEFLPVRMLQTIDNTKLKDVKTIREVLEVIGKEKGMTADEVAKIKPTEFHRYMGDVTLARQHPFFERLVTIKNESFMKANARVLELTDEIDDLVTKARASKSRGIADRAVPTDDNIVHWLESDAETRAVIEKKMTPEEITAGKRMDDVFKEYYDYLVKKNADKKFSRFEDQYFPHVRRGFLEAWKEDGVLKAFKEMRDQFAQDQKYMNILNEQTGDILPYEKWVGFSQYRSDNLVPTANAARAFESYVTTLEKARHLDEMVPEIMAYVHALSPRTLSERGIELDSSLKRFVKEWINANKGRHPKGFFEPGGKLDWTLRASTGFTRMMDLGFNFTTQLVAPIGENAMTLTMLKPEAYAKAVIRKNTAQGKAVLEKYKSFTGRSIFEELNRATTGIGDKFLSGMFAMYHVASKQANELFLLGKLTDNELATGIVSTERLAELQLEMGKYRKIKGLESVIERTSEAQAALQYKSWALPIFRATVTNSLDLAKLIKKDGVAKALGSDAGKELFYSIGLSAGIAGIFYHQYKSLSDEKERSFIEDLTFKALRDAQSIFGAFDPTMWATVRVVQFYEDFANAILDLVTLDEYKETGELKAPKEFLKLITPAPVRQLQRELKSGDKKTPAKKTIPTPKGLPKLPTTKGKLPTPPGLPTLP